MDSGTLGTCVTCHYQWCRMMELDELEYCLEHEDDWSSPCPHWKEMTTGDYISSLTDEEMGAYLNDLKFSGTLLSKEEWINLMRSTWRGNESR